MAIIVAIYLGLAFFGAGLIFAGLKMINRGNCFVAIYGICVVMAGLGIFGWLAEILFAP